MAINKNSSAERQTLSQFLSKHLCGFETGGRRCQLLGTIADEYGKRYLCDWHFAIAGKVEFAQDFNEFVLWREKQRGRYPLKHDNRLRYVDDGIVWRAIIGKMAHVELAGHVPRNLQEMEMVDFCKLNDLPYPVTGEGDRAKHIAYVHSMLSRVGQ
jgi:hypothetical protein